ncbi:MAG TPA: PCRF domain-containing protein, partial [Bacillota bacterium]|nr:PCRF domain-containing protein [Bacillota bacterium]
MILEEIRTTVEQNRMLLEPLSQSLRLDQDADERERLTKETADAVFWSDPKRASIVQKRITYLTKKSKRFAALSSQIEDLAVLLELAEEENDHNTLHEVEEGLKEWSKEYESLRLQTLLTGEHDAMNA